MPKRRRTPSENGTKSTPRGLLGKDYFRIRDFEYAQPLYDLAFLLEVAALAKGTEVPKYRTFALWRAGYSLDGYGTTIDRWLDGALQDQDLDCVPSSRIRQYLTNIRSRGTLPELRSYRGERFDRCLRLRSVRGLGPSKIALAVSSRSTAENWLTRAAINPGLDRKRLTELYENNNPGPWQTAHIVPPLLRLLNTIEKCSKELMQWDVLGIADPLEPVTGPVSVLTNMDFESFDVLVDQALKREKHFSRSKQDVGCIKIRHQMGWSFVIYPGNETTGMLGVPELAAALDPLANNSAGSLLSDLHLHTAWSDGNASVNDMALAAVASGLKYFAVTDHSRTAKLQGGLTPPLWLRQANALALARPVCPVMHGIEVDILKDGTLDLPPSLLSAADIVVASVHSNWTDEVRTNTDRLLKAVESGCIDILAHPTSAVIGTPGAPDYVRAPALVYWDEVFESCARWRVALEFNCFPSRLDLPLNLLRKAVAAGCPISIGSDSHARSHLINRRFGEAALRRIDAAVVLNRLSYEELKEWVAESRTRRKNLPVTAYGFGQPNLPFVDSTNAPSRMLTAHIKPPQNIPTGSRVLGIDLTAGDKATGVAVLDGCSVDTCSLSSDEEILAYIRTRRPKIVSIDSPLGLPGGGSSIDPEAGIMRVAEHDLASIGIPAYPSLIDSMQNLTLRGIRLRRSIEQFSRPPQVIESYPGAAQDILSIPRKQRSLDLLREGLRRLGLQGSGLQTHSHDEMDAITSAVVGRYFEAGLFEPMGIPSEAQLIVPKVSSLRFDKNPVICLAGKTGAGKSVVARYLSVFYGFEWIRTRNAICEIIVEDTARDPGNRLFQQAVDPAMITENDLREIGAVILDKYNQIPLRQKLTEMITRLRAPAVVDSIRDGLDVDRSALGNRPLLIWFVECNDVIIRDRLARRSRLGSKRSSVPSPVDKTASIIRINADKIIVNSASLEELRWRLDDAIFSITNLHL